MGVSFLLGVIIDAIWSGANWWGVAHINNFFLNSYFPYLGSSAAKTSLLFSKSIFSSWRSAGEVGVSGKLCVMGWSVVEYTVLGMEGIPSNQEAWVSFGSLTGMEEMLERVQGNPSGDLVVFGIAKGNY